MRHYNNPMYKNLQFTEHYNARTMTPDEVLERLASHCGRRNPFFVNGRPFITADEYEEQHAAGKRVLLQFKTLDFVDNIAGWYWGENYDASTWIDKADIAGLEMVTVYCGKEYCGRYYNMLLKQPDENDKLVRLAQELDSMATKAERLQRITDERKAGNLTDNDVIDLCGKCFYL